MISSSYMDIWIKDNMSRLQNINHRDYRWGGIFRYKHLIDHQPYLDAAVIIQRTLKQQSDDYIAEQARIAAERERQSQYVGWVNRWDETLNSVFDIGISYDGYIPEVDEYVNYVITKANEWNIEREGYATAIAAEANGFQDRVGWASTRDRLIDKARAGKTNRGEEQAIIALSNYRREGASRYGDSLWAFARWKLVDFFSDCDAYVSMGGSYNTIISVGPTLFGSSSATKTGIIANYAYPFDNKYSVANRTIVMNAHTWERHAFQVWYPNVVRGIAPLFVEGMYVYLNISDKQGMYYGCTADEGISRGSLWT